MVSTMKYPNRWDSGDPRFEGMLEAANEAIDAFDNAYGSTEAVPDSEIRSPTQTVKKLREVADNIEGRTEV